MASFTTVISQRRKLRHRKVEGLPRITRVGFKPNNSGLAPPVLAWGAGVVGSCRRWAHRGRGTLGRRASGLLNHTPGTAAC